MPPWLRALPELAKASGTADAPLAIVHLSALPGALVLPRGPTLSAPKSASLYLEAVPAGFVLRGKASFASAPQAAAFVEGMRAYRLESMDSIVSKTLLRQFQVYNLLVGLSLKQRGPVVTFSTSLSVADARSIFEVAAGWSAGFFGRGALAP